MRVKMSKQPPPAPTASAVGWLVVLGLTALISAVGPCPTVIQIVGRPGTGSLPSTIAPPNHPMSKVKVTIGGGRVERRCWVNFQCRGVLLVWMIVGQGPIALAVGAGGGCLDIFSLIYLFNFLSLSL